uniref:Delta(24)-sterol reductase n=1 Tax=Plectus sambesii TaxID=2011161 RepID=A0A914UU02_9BILA
TLTKTLEAESNNRENEFVEGLAFSKSTGVVMRGKFSDNPPKNGVINAIGRWYKPWFFTHVKAILDRNEIVTEYIPLRDYYHRHSKSIFWEIQEIIPFGNNWAFRYFVGWASPPKISLLKLTMPKPIKNLYERHHVLQDMLIPLSQLDQAIKVFDREVEIYPVWLCPYNLPSAPGMLRQRSGRNILYVDVGVYGTVTKPDYRPRETTRRLEKFVRSVEGVQMLYADTYMTRAEFWEMFDSSLYEWLRVKYGCKDAFPDVYDKVSKAARD